MNKFSLFLLLLLTKHELCNLTLVLFSVAGVMLSIENPTHETFQNLTSDVDTASIEKLYPGIVTLISRALRLPTNKLKRDDFIHDLKEIK